MMQGIMQGLAAQMQAERGASLTDILTPDQVEPLLSDQAAAAQLMEYLPEGSNSTIEELRANIRSPQFSQALAAFTAALQSGDLDAAMSQFGVDGAAAARAGGGVAGLVAAIQQSEEGQGTQVAEEGAEGESEPMDKAE
eukprot:UC1_evm1s2037